VIFELFSPHVTRWLSAYCEGVLPAPVAGRVAAHVLGCQRCHRELALVRTGAALAARLGPGEPSEAELPSWSDLAPLLDEPGPARPQLWRWIPATAVALLIVAGGLALRHRALSATGAIEQEAVAVHRGAPLTLPPGERVVRRWIAGEPVTLLVAGAAASSETPRVAVQPALATKPIRYRSVDDLQVASWTSNDRRYVLVSPLAGDAACSICHTVL
jgi:anti-sigma factor RsiW